MKDVLVLPHQKDTDTLSSNLLGLRRSVKNIQIQQTVFPDRHITPPEPSVEIWKNKLHKDSDEQPHISERIKRLIPQSDHHILLEGSGFDILLQIANISKEFENAQEKNLEEIHESIIQKTAEDLRAFWIEFLKQSPLLQYRLEKTGEKITAPNYKNEELISLSDIKEREGATLEGIIEFAKRIYSANTGEIILLTSPSGWASDGGWKHPETQTYAALILSDGSIDAVTFRSDMSLAESRKFMENHGANFETTQTTNKEEIKSVVKTVVTVQGKNLAEVLEGIKTVTGKNDILPGKTFESTFDLLKNRNLLHAENPLVGNIIDDITRYVETNLISPDDNVLADFALFLGRKAIELSYFTRAKEALKVVRRRGNNKTFTNPQKLTDEQLLRESQHIQQLDGCRSKLQSKTMKKALSALGLTIAGESKYVKNCGACGAVIESRISKGYICKSCGGVYEGC